MKCEVCRVYEHVCLPPNNKYFILTRVKEHVPPSYMPPPSCVLVKYLMLRSKRCLARLITAFLPSTPASGQYHPVGVIMGRFAVDVFISTATSSITYAGVSPTAAFGSEERERNKGGRNKGEEMETWRGSQIGSVAKGEKRQLGTIANLNKID